jgi:restriction endonuclease Mrr
MDLLDIQWLTILATPAELIASSHHALTAALEADLLNRVRKMPPAFFEAVIIDVLIRLGYGGGQPHMGEVIGRSGDGGIDGVIKEDALGLDIIYVQAKRYAEGRTVGRPEVQMFAGSLDGVGATKGILITTGSFSAGARKYVANIPKRIVLIGGNQLTRLMVEHDVGVQISEIYMINDGYFSAETPKIYTVSTAAGSSRATSANAGVDRGGPGARAPAADPYRWVGLRSRRPATPRIKPAPRSAAHR